MKPVVIGHRGEGDITNDSCPIPLIFVGYRSIKQIEWTQISIQTGSIPWAL
jgi:hypothetical protein